MGYFFSSVGQIDEEKFKTTSRIMVMKILTIIHSQFQSKGRNTSASFRAYSNPHTLEDGGLIA